jgi:hypothetical protein
MFISQISAQEVKPTLAILNILPVNIEESKALSVYGSITNGIYKLDSYSIIERSEIAKQINMKDMFVNGPVENNVAINAGKTAGAKLVLITSLSMDKGMYYLSMKLINVSSGKTIRIVKSTTDFNKVVELAIEIEKVLLVNKPAIIDASNQNSVDGVARKPTLTKKSFYFSTGLDCMLPIPIADAGTFLNLTVSPGLFFDLSFDYFGVKEFPEYYVIAAPATIKVDYIFPFDDFYFFGGIKGGLIYVNYQTFNLNETKTGFLPFISPEIGAGYLIAGCIGISLGTSLDMTIFANWNMHINMTPFIKVMYLF